MLVDIPLYTHQVSALSVKFEFSQGRGRGRGRPAGWLGPEPFFRLNLNLVGKESNAGSRFPDMPPPSPPSFIPYL